VGNFSLKRNKSSFKRAIVSFCFWRVSLNFCGRISPVKRVCDQEHASFEPIYFIFKSLRANPFLNLGFYLLNELFTGIKRPLLVKTALARNNGAIIGFLRRQVCYVNRKTFSLESECVELKKFIQ